jgi:hypothetical protein
MVLLDGRLSCLTAVAQALATSPSIKHGDVSAFRSQAVRAARGQDFDLVLEDVDRERLLDTAHVNASPRSSGSSASYLRKVVSSGRPIISDRDDASGNRLVSVSVPIVRLGVVRYVLSSTVQASRLLASVTPPNAHRTWQVTLTDRAGKAAAVIGPSVPADGPGATAKSRISDLRVALRGPTSGAFSIATGLAHDRIIAIGLATTLIGLLAAALLGRMISRSLRQVRESARSLARDGEASPVSSGIREMR